MCCEQTFTVHPIGEQSIVMSVSVCGSVCWHISQKSHVQTSPNFLCVLPMAVALFSCGGVLERYALPVLWMTSCLYTMARTSRCERVYAETGSPRGSTVPGAESGVYDCLVVIVLCCTAHIIHSCLLTNMLDLSADFDRFKPYINCC